MEHNSSDGDRYAALANSSTSVAVQDGKWSDPAIWAGEPPASLADIEIVADVEYDLEDSDYDSIVVRPGGCLHHATTKNTRLRVRTLTIQEGGCYEIGTPEEPIPAGRTAELVFSPVRPDYTRDPEEMLGGLLAWGEVTMCGATKTPFIRLAEEPGGGNDWLRTKTEPAGWLAGDRLAIPPSGGPTMYRGRRPLEFATVNSLFLRGDLYEITLREDLTGIHQGGYDAAGHCDFFPHVANLSRSVVVRSLHPQERRGHVLFTGMARPDIRYVHFLNLGRTMRGTLPIGRYGLHAHHLEGCGTPALPRFTFQGCVVEDESRTMRWGLVVHASHGGLVRGNIVLGADVAGLVTEDGSESYNVFEGNLVLDINEHAYWLNGARNTFRGNVAACCNTQLAGAGFYLPPNLDAHLVHTVPIPGGGEETFKHIDQTFFAFEDNEAYSVRSGLWLDHRSPTTGHRISDHAVWSSWGNDADGLSHPSWGIACASYDSGTVTYLRLKSRNASIDIYSQVETQIIDCDVQGSRRGVRDQAQNGKLTIEGGLYANRANLSLLLSPSAGAGPLPPPGVALKTTRIVGADLRPGPDWSGWNILLESVFQGQQSRVPTVLHTMEVIDSAGLAGEWRLYFSEQQADVIVPCVDDIPTDPTGVFVKCGAPVRGLTNAECWKQFQIAWAGAVAPADAVEVPGIAGLASRASIS